MNKGQTVFGVVITLGFFLIIFGIGFAPILSQTALLGISSLGLSGVEAFVLNNLNWLIVMIALLAGMYLVALQ